MAKLRQKCFNPIKDMSQNMLAGELPKKTINSPDQ